MKPNILVVDDNASLRKLLNDALAGDYNVIEAGDGIFGLAEVMGGERKIDLIITDLDMPESNGIEFIENLSEGIPVIIISGYLERPEFQDALQSLHPAAIFRKPFSLDKLREAIGSTIRKSRPFVDRTHATAP